MVNNCAIRTCKEKYSANIMMHSIPKSVDMRDKWLKAIRQHAPDFKPTAHSKICSLHFKKSDYMLSVVSYRKMLRKGAIPSIFTAAQAHESSLNSKETVYDHTYCRQVCEIPVDTKSEPSTSFPMDRSVNVKPNITPTPILITPIPMSSFSNVCVPTFLEEPQFKTPYKPRKRKHYVGDFVIDDIESPNRRLQFWHASQRSFHSQRRTIKDLRTKNYRLKKTIFNLDQMIDHLKNENKIDEKSYKLLKRSLTRLH